MHSLTTDIVLRSLGQVGSTVLAILAGVIVLETAIYLIFGKLLKHRHTLPIMLLAPAAIGLLALIVYPIIYEVVLSFSNMSLFTFRNPKFGLMYAERNFGDVFTQPVLKLVHFLPVFLRTVLWTTIQVTFHVTFGMILALLLNRPMKLRGLYRTLLIVPWAIPQVVAVLAWRGEFQFEYGFLNIVLRDIGLHGIEWKSSPFWNFVAINITNIWLGVPFMMVILLGGLQSIDKTYYEAAEMDGAGPWRRFRDVTLPLINPVLTPAVILGVIWTTNNFNVPYFINEYNLESSEILVTALFRAAFDYSRFGFSAAFAIVIFLILLIFAVIYIRFSGLESVMGRSVQKPVPAGIGRKTATRSPKGPRGEVRT